MQKYLYAVAATFCLTFSINAYSFMADGDDAYSSGYSHKSHHTIKPKTQHLSFNAVTYNDPAFEEDNNDSSYNDDPPPVHHKKHHYSSVSEDDDDPVPSGDRVIIVNPRTHTWGAYVNGERIRGGLASAGSSWCHDLGRPCRTRSGTFYIHSLGGPDCYSRKFPLGRGGAPMPYCMFFNGGQGIHGSNELADANISHGCVRISVGSAHWLRYNFAHIGTKIIVKSY